MTTSFVQNLIEGERENEEEEKDSIRQEELFAMVQQFRKGKGKGKSKGKGKGKGVRWNCGDGDHYSRDCPNDKQDSWTETMSWKGHQDSRMSKGWDTGKGNWNSAKGKGKEWQPYGKWSSTKGKFGSKGKGSIYSVDGITESDGWTQSDDANSQEDPHFCIMEHSQDVVMDDINNQAPTNSPARGDPLRQNVPMGAVELGDQHEWRNVRSKNFLKKQRQDYCIPLRNKFQMLGFLESERSDDDDMEAPKNVFDDNENGRWIKEEAVVDSGAVECFTSRKRVPHLKVEETPE